MHALVLTKFNEDLEELETCFEKCYQSGDRNLLNGMNSDDLARITKDMA